MRSIGGASAVGLRECHPSLWTFPSGATLLGPPVERLETVYFSRGTLPPKKGDRAILGDLANNVPFRPAWKCILRTKEVCALPGQRQACGFPGEEFTVFGLNPTTKSWMRLQTQLVVNDCLPSQWLQPKCVPCLKLQRFRDQRSRKLHARCGRNLPLRSLGHVANGHLSMRKLSI